MPQLSGRPAGMLHPHMQTRPCYIPRHKVVRPQAVIPVTGAEFMGISERGQGRFLGTSEKVVTASTPYSSGW